MRAGRRHDESGQASPVLLLVLVASLALSVAILDGPGRAALLSNEARTAAEAAALAGADHARDAFEAGPRTFTPPPPPAPPSAPGLEPPEEPEAPEPPVLAGIDPDVAAAFEEELEAFEDAYEVYEDELEAYEDTLDDHADAMADHADALAAYPGVVDGLLRDFADGAVAAAVRPDAMRSRAREFALRNDAAPGSVDTEVDHARAADGLSGRVLVRAALEREAERDGTTDGIETGDAAEAVATAAFEWRLVGDLASGWQLEVDDVTIVGS